MNRYFIELSYDGTAYAGWQIQPSIPTVQAILEEKMSTQWRESIKLTGCGRTDAGVHARGYFAHFDTEKTLDKGMMYKLNAFLPDDIAVHAFHRVKEDAHARFDAIKRRYRYFIHFEKSPFYRNYSFYIPHRRSYRLDLMSELTTLLTDYNAFKPFCKAGAEVKHYRCRIDNMYWEVDENKRVARLTVEANRFLHGMIRFIVGASLSVAAGRMSLIEVRDSMDKQIALPLAYKAPACGLFLDKISYPYLISSESFPSLPQLPQMES